MNTQEVCQLHGGDSNDTKHVYVADRDIVPLIIFHILAITSYNSGFNHQVKNDNNQERRMLFTPGPGPTLA